MSNKIKKVINTKPFYFILGALIFGTIGVSAATYFPSNDVTYDNTKSGLSSTNVQGAIDELYNTCMNPPKTPSEIIIENAGLEKDPYECRYFFTGANPNNYITFNGETAGWRIISVECDGTIKIIKRSSIHYSRYDDDSMSVTWDRIPTINTYLNSTYYNELNSTAKSQIDSHIFSIGSLTNNNYNLQNTINNENGATWKGNIALPTVSEFLRTNSDSKCKTYNLYNINYSTCENTTWMLKDYSNWWFLTHDSIDHALFVNGEIDSESSNIYTGVTQANVRPVIYISSKVKITGGDGFENNPYILG